MKIFDIGLPNKKASLNLSINAIVIIVLAMTLLGLGLGFIRGMFKQFGGITKEVQEKIKEQVLDDLQRGEKKLSISSQLEIEKGSDYVFGVGVMNRGDRDLTTGVEITFKEQKGCTTDCDDVGFFYSKEVNNVLSPTDSKVFYITATAPSASGTYLYELVVNAVPDDATECIGDACEIYDRQTFFVKVI